MPEDLKKGELICVENAFFQINYKGALILKVDPFARVVRLQEGDENFTSTSCTMERCRNCCL